MPRLEIRPWRIADPQIVWRDRYGWRRVVVSYQAVSDENIGVREVFFEERNGCDGMGEDRWNDCDLGKWRDLIIDLLDIPETIKEEE